MDKQYRSIEYKFRDQRIYTNYYALASIGMEYWPKGSLYHRNCRNAQERQCVFQYTVSGEGALRYNNRTYSMRPGQAFLVEKPGMFTYYLPDASDHWEFKYIAMNLDSLNIWRDITQRFGRIVNLKPDCDLMQFWDRLYHQALNNQMGSFFQASAVAYEFMMRLMYTLQKQETKSADNSVPQKCLELIQSNYNQELTLDALAAACAVSPSYLNRKFREVYGTSPIQYLIRHRVDVAASLLLRENLQVAEVSQEVGFRDPNYFTRRFKQITGVSPSKYRLTESIRTVDDTSMYLEISPTYRSDVWEDEI